MRNRPSLLALALALAACDGAPPEEDAQIQLPDAGPTLLPSQLFGPCEVDSQCPGEGAVCRTAADGWPGGYCTVPCEDRTPCDHRGVYHHCATREGETQAYCERRCLNGIDCGRDAYTCAGELPPSGGVCIGLCSSDEQCGAGTVCNLYSGACTAESLPGGAVTGEPCIEGTDCRSGQCVGEVTAMGAPTGWIGGYCIASCMIPSGYNTSTFFAGDALPRGTCAGDAVCIPAEGYAEGDLGTCYDQCLSDDDCRAGYTCLRDIALTGGGASSYSNGLCVPDDCGRVGCPSGYTCVTVMGANGARNVCARR